MDFLTTMVALGLGVVFRGAVRIQWRQRGNERMARDSLNVEEFRSRIAARELALDTIAQTLLEAGPKDCRAEVAASLRWNQPSRSA